MTLKKREGGSQWLRKQIISTLRVVHWFVRSVFLSGLYDYHHPIAYITTTFKRKKKRWWGLYWDDLHWWLTFLAFSVPGKPLTMGGYVLFGIKILLECHPCVPQKDTRRARFLLKGRPVLLLIQGGSINRKGRPSSNVTKVIASIHHSLGIHCSLLSVLHAHGPVGHICIHLLPCWYSQARCPWTEHNMAEDSGCENQRNMEVFTISHRIRSTMITPPPVEKLLVLRKIPKYLGITCG